jgi:thiamine kinase-like enzyme
VSREDIDGMRAVRDLLAAQPLPPLRPIHGDSHFNNILWTPDGPRWTDFENLCAGPVEFDLACISWRERPENEAAFAAYGPHDEELRARMEPYLALFLAPWTVVIAERRPDHGIDEARRRVRKALEPLAD